MVQWYAPLQLLATGLTVLVTETLGGRVDYRLMQDTAEQPIFDYTRDEAGAPRDELWFDFLADTGDGWNPTYAVASLLARPELTVEVPDRAEAPHVRRAHRLPRGTFVLLGGDQVYPVASQQNYRERFVGPYTAALPAADGVAPHMFAVPGNHDWYDNLVAFSRLFMRGREIGGWRTRQRRSYFALQLPHRWWLLAVDVRLESDIDPGQLDHFRRTVAPRLRPGDRVILASAEPDWLYRDIATVADSNLWYLEQRVIHEQGARVHLWLAGDVHNYRRHEKRGNPSVQRICSGGGGAYLSPTHGPLFGAATSASRRIVRVGEDEFEPRRAFPSPSTSFRLSLLNALFLLKNWKLGLVTGLVYAVLAWQRAPDTPLTQGAAAQPLGLVWMLLILATCVFFADKRYPALRWAGGTLHGVAHVAAALAIASWSAGYFGETAGGQAGRLGLAFAAGAVVAPVIWGLYLLLAVDLFGAHDTEAFSALRIEDYKHFLRLHVRPDGQLDVYPIGIVKVPRVGARVDYTLVEGPVPIRVTAADGGRDAP